MVVPQQTIATYEAALQDTAQATPSPEGASADTAFPGSQLLILDREFWWVLVETESTPN